MKHFFALVLLAFGLTASAQISCPSGFVSTGTGPAGPQNLPCGISLIYYDHQGFAAVTANGAAMNGSALTLIPYPGGHAASALMYQTPVNVQDFTTNFTFVPDGKNIALAFNNTNNQPGFEGAGFAGGAGCEAGFYQAFTNPEINNVFALELDSSSALSASAPYPYTFTYSGTQIYQAQQSPCIPPYKGSDGNTDYTPSKISTSPVSLNTTDTYSATITYDGSNLTLALYDITAGGACPGAKCFTNTWTGVNIPSLVGGTTAYVGITGGTNTDNTGPLVIKSMVYSTGAPFTPPPATVATPTFIPAAGAYTSAQTITISDLTAGATIYYSVNGGATQAYTTPIALGSSATITAYATAPGDTQSATATAAYAISIPPPVVTLSIPAQTIPITIMTGGSAISATITIPAQTVTVPQ